jgi:hypothetical protein
MAMPVNTREAYDLNKPWSEMNGNEEAEVRSKRAGGKSYDTCFSAQSTLFLHENIQPDWALVESLNKMGVWITQTNYLLFNRGSTFQISIRPKQLFADPEKWVPLIEVAVIQHKLGG